MPWKDNEMRKAWRRKYAAQNPDKVKAWSTASKRKLRERLFVRYGRICALCGCNDIRVLDLDHIYGRAKSDSSKGTSTIYKALKAPDGVFRILCKNCNWIAYLERAKPKS